MSGDIRNRLDRLEQQSPVREPLVIEVFYFDHATGETRLGSTFVVDKVRTDAPTHNQTTTAD